MPVWPSDIFICQFFQSLDSPAPQTFYMHGCPIVSQTTGLPRPTKDSTFARLVGIIAKFFTPRARSRRSMPGDGDDDGENGDGENGDDGEGAAQAAGGEAPVDPSSNEGEKSASEDCEVDEDGDLEFQEEKLAALLGGTPRPSPTKWSPQWSPGRLMNRQEVPAAAPAPEPESLEAVTLALRQLEYLDGSPRTLLICFDSSNMKIF